MQEYSIHRATRRCHQSDRPFAPGESYVSSVVQKGKDLVRVDVAHSLWSGPADNTIGWWLNRVPADSKVKKLVPAPTSVLLDSLERLLENPDDQDLAYLLALLLTRRRVLSEPNSRTHALESNTSEFAEGLMQLKHLAQDREFLVPVRSPSSERVDDLSRRLVELLYSET